MAKAKSAVIGWGRGMGHTGHDELVKATIHQARKTGATPFFIVSKSFGKDDPIPPQMKLDMYKKKFPEYTNIFSVATDEKPSINDQLALVASKGFTDGTLVVGADQKDAFGYMIRPDKSGTEPYKKFGFDNFKVMSRQETGLPSSNPDSPDYHEGPRATPMREVLLDPNKTEDEQFEVWREAMSQNISDDDVLAMMRLAKENLMKFHTEKPKGRKLKEFISDMRKMIHEASPAQKVKLLKLLKEYNVRQTKKFIQRAHDEEQGQTYGTLPYSSHPKQVARIGKKFFGSEFGEDARKVALLHDILEDTPYTAQQLAKKGFSKEVIQAVQLLTKNKALSYADNISAIIDSGNKLAMMVKYADNYVNYTGDKSDWAPEKAALSQKKYMNSLNRLGDVLGVKKHLEAQTNVTENADYLSEK
jgi:hypothetical protein